MDEEKPRKRVRRSWGKKRAREEGNARTGDGHVSGAPDCPHHQRSGDSRELGSSQDSGPHLCKRKGDLPKWVKEGIEENEEWLKEMKERPGENIGSPHVRVCLVALHALITSEEAQQQKFEQSLKGLKEWWKVMTKEGKAREKEVAAEIRSN